MAGYLDECLALGCKNGNIEGLGWLLSRTEPINFDQPGLIVDILSSHIDMSQKLEIVKILIRRGASIYDEDLQKLTRFITSQDSESMAKYLAFIAINELVEPIEILKLIESEFETIEIIDCLRCNNIPLSDGDDQLGAFKYSVSCVENGWLSVAIYVINELGFDKSHTDYIVAAFRSGNDQMINYIIN